MLAEARQAKILRLLHDRGSVRVSDLVDMLNVSDMTIRRDLETLAATGEVDKVHGGALLRHTRAEEPGFEAKQRLDVPEKEAIAAAAVQLVRRGSSIAISAGTTTWAFARALARGGLEDITVVTNSVNVWMMLRGGSGDTSPVILTGGVYRTPSDALVGPIADAALRSLNVDTLFLGVHGMDLEAGYTTPNLAEAETDRTMISRCRQLVVLADHTKWQNVGLCAIAPISAASVVVTDDGLVADGRRALSQHVGRLVVAGAVNY